MEAAISEPDPVPRRRAQAQRREAAGDPAAPDAHSNPWPHPWRAGPGVNSAKAGSLSRIASSSRVGLDSHGANFDL